MGLASSSSTVATPLPSATTAFLALESRTEKDSCGSTAVSLISATGTLRVNGSPFLKLSVVLRPR